MIRCSFEKLNLLYARKFKSPVGCANTSTRYYYYLNPSEAVNLLPPRPAAAVAAAAPAGSDVVVSSAGVAGGPAAAASSSSSGGSAVVSAAGVTGGVVRKVDGPGPGVAGLTLNSSEEMEKCLGGVDGVDVASSSSSLKRSFTCIAYTVYVQYISLSGVWEHCHF